MLRTGPVLPRLFALLVFFKSSASLNLQSYHELGSLRTARAFVPIRGPRRRRSVGTTARHRRRTGTASTDGARRVRASVHDDPAGVRPEDRAGAKTSGGRASQ